jgi:hypothetical protein
VQLLNRKGPKEKNNDESNWFEDVNGGGAAVFFSDQMYG